MVKFLLSGGMMMPTAEGLRRFKPKPFAITHMLAGGRAEDGLSYAGGEGDRDNEIELPNGTRVAGIRADMQGDGVYTGNVGIDAANLAWRGQYRDGRETRVITISLNDGGADMSDPGARQVRVVIALDMAAELAAEYFPGSKFVAFAHVDRAHVHVHLVIENFDPLTGRRWSLRRYQCERMQDLDWHRAGLCQPGKETARCRLQMLDSLAAELAAGSTPEELIKDGRLVRLPAEGHYDFNRVSFRPETLRQTGHLDIAARLGIDLPRPAKMSDRRETAMTNLRSLLAAGKTREALEKSRRLTVKERTKAGGESARPSFTFDGITFRADTAVKHGHLDVIELLGLPGQRAPRRTSQGSTLRAKPRPGTYEQDAVVRNRRDKCYELELLLSKGRRRGVSAREIAERLESTGHLSFVRALPNGRELRNPVLKFHACRMRESTLRHEGHNAVADLIRHDGAGTPNGLSKVPRHLRGSAPASKPRRRTPAESTPHSRTFDSETIALNRRERCGQLESLLIEGIRQNVSPQQVVQRLELEGRLSFIRALSNGRKLRNPALKFLGCRMREETLRREGRKNLADLVRDDGKGTRSGLLDKERLSLSAPLEATVPPPVQSDVLGSTSKPVTVSVPSSSSVSEERSTEFDQKDVTIPAESVVENPPHRCEGEMKAPDVFEDDRRPDETKPRLDADQGTTATLGPKPIAPLMPSQSSAKPQFSTLSPPGGWRAAEKGAILSPIPILGVKLDGDWMDKLGIIFIGAKGFTSEHFAIPSEFIRGYRPQEQANKYKAWLDGTDHQEVEPEQREWILAQIPLLRKARALISWEPDLHGRILIEKAFDLEDGVLLRTPIEEGQANPAGVILHFGPHFGKTLMQVEMEYLQWLAALDGRGGTRNPVPLGISKGAATVLKIKSQEMQLASGNDMQTLKNDSLPIGEKPEEPPI